jgi:tRNA pseudouridine38-40 synthase
MDPLLYTYKMTVAYDGTNYCGWQIQPNGLTIQECLQDALKILFKTPTQVIGAGRTDSGVHAHGQVASFEYSHPLDLYRFLASINGIIPRDIRVLAIEPALLKFHPQHHAVSKKYSYHFREKIDLQTLKVAAEQFIGTHDFTSFAKENHSGAASKNAIRTLSRLDVIPELGGVRLEFEADGFLYGMVRCIVGTLLDAAAGKIEIDDINEIFTAHNRSQAGAAAPPHALFLAQVNY